MKRTLILFFTILFALLLAACAGDKEDSPAADTQTPASDTQTEPADTDGGESGAGRDGDEAPAPEDAEPADADTAEDAAEPSEAENSETAEGGEPAETAGDSAETPASDETPKTPGTLSLTDKQRYEANIFLSNFSEQGFCEYGSRSFNAADATDAQVYSFAHLWAKINRNRAIGYKNEYETMTLDLVNEIAGRYLELGRKLNPADGTDYSKELGMGNYDWDRVWFEDGLFFFPAADGEIHTGFTVVREARSLLGGLVSFDFDTYDMDIDSYFDKDGIPKDYYYMTSEDARQLASTGEISRRGSGKAVCAPKTLDNGRETYGLISYSID